ncbi:MAG: hypothetical protein CYG59_06025 [Chloroflexi bacterium]|nr:MAG: hypothetical protein CYG59_06025 [Chloroflexota bacterium]
MREAETILTTIRERGKKDLPLERVYRLLFNRNLYLEAYARLYKNKGAMTKGSTSETIDGMSLAKIDALIEKLRYERYHWTPVRRVEIPKANGKKRPLGIPSWSDKLLQEVMRSILEAYYEPQFCPQSHGFRPNHGCHTALHEIQHTWKGTIWYIEGDIAQYFDTINHNKLLEILSERIHDGRFLNLIRSLLAAGYMENWRFHPTLSGAPQGGIISPLLSNIYLHKFDQWITTELIPAHTRGTKREKNPAYMKILSATQQARKHGQKDKAKALIKLRRTLPSINPNDPNYRRLRYIRYADDFLLGYAGTKREAEEIKQRIGEWLRDNLNLTLSDEKTLITHARTTPARFLGYEISCMHLDNKFDAHKRRIHNGNVTLRIPASVVKQRCARYMKDGRPIHRPELLADSDYDIITRYQQEYRGIVQYYLPAPNIGWLARIHWAMRGSLLKTLAHKHKCSVAFMVQKLRATVQTPEGKTLTCLEIKVERQDKPPLIARFGGISLSRQPTAKPTDYSLQTWQPRRTELIQRLLAQECELCGATENIEVHHIRKLADLNMKGRKEKPLWVQVMAARRRKTLVVCRTCHMAIQYGKPRQKTTK